MKVGIHHLYYVRARILVSDNQLILYFWFVSDFLIFDLHHGNFKNYNDEFCMPTTVDFIANQRNFNKLKWQKTFWFFQLPVGYSSLYTCFKTSRLSVPSKCLLLLGFEITPIFYLFIYFLVFQFIYEKYIHISVSV